MNLKWGVYKNLKTFYFLNKCNMDFIKTWLRSRKFWLFLIVICIILMVVDIHFDLSDFWILSLISLILALIFLIIFLIVRSKDADNGVKRLLTFVISAWAIWIISLLLSGLDYFYYLDIDLDFFLPITWIIFFISWTLLLLKLVWRKK